MESWVDWWGDAEVAEVEFITPHAWQSFHFDRLNAPLSDLCAIAVKKSQRPLFFSLQEDNKSLEIVI